MVHPIARATSSKIIPKPTAPLPHISNVDSYPPADVGWGGSPAIPFSARNFVNQEPTVAEQLGQPILNPRTEITDLAPGEVLVASRGVDAPDEKWYPMPADSDRICLLKARGLVFVEKKRLLKTVHDALSDSSLIPWLLAGVEESRNIDFLPTQGPNEIKRDVNWQRNDSIQYLSIVVTRRFGHGYTYEQRTIHDKDLLDKYQYAFNGSDRPSDRIEYSGQIQVFEVPNGTAVLMEMRAYSSNLDHSCDISADSTNHPLQALGLVISPEKMKTAVRQRITIRLEHFRELMER